MTPATSTAPTADEILQIIAARTARYPIDSLDAKLDEAIGNAFDAIGYVSLDEQGAYDIGAAFLSDTWGDLRPSEAARLGEIISEAQERAEEKARAAIIEEVIGAALTFAAEYPDAPRAEVTE